MLGVPLETLGRHLTYWTWQEIKMWLQACVCFPHTAKHKLKVKKKQKLFKKKKFPDDKLFHLSSSALFPARLSAASCPVKEHYSNITYHVAITRTPNPWHAQLPEVMLGWKKKKKKSTHLVFLEHNLSCLRAALRSDSFSPEVSQQTHFIEREKKELLIRFRVRHHVLFISWDIPVGFPLFRTLT